MTPDDAHFLQSLSVDLTNRGETYFGQRCGEIAAALTAAAGVGDEDKNALIERCKKLTKDRAELSARIAELEEECEKSAHGCFTRNTRISELEAALKSVRAEVDLREAPKLMAKIESALGLGP